MGTSAGNELRCLSRHHDQDTESCRVPIRFVPISRVRGRGRRRSSGIVKRIQILVAPKDQLGRRLMDLVLSRSVDCKQFEIITELLVRRVRHKTLTKGGRRHAASTQVVVTRNG